MTPTPRWSFAKISLHPALLTACTSRSSGPSQPTAPCSVAVSGTPFGEYRDIVPKLGMDFGVAPGSAAGQLPRARTGGELLRLHRRDRTSGRFETTVEQMETPYVVPQDYGNRRDVRWAALTDPTGHGLLVEADGPLLNVSAWQYSCAAIDTTGHRADLVPDPDAVTLNIDHRLLGTRLELLGRGGARYAPRALGELRVRLPPPGTDGTGALDMEIFTDLDQFERVIAGRPKWVRTVQAIHSAPDRREGVMYSIGDSLTYLRTRRRHDTDLFTGHRRYLEVIAAGESTVQLRDLRPRPPHHVGSTTATSPIASTSPARGRNSFCSPARSWWWRPMRRSAISTPRHSPARCCT